jgi:hypothetical protein
MVIQNINAKGEILNYELAGAKAHLIFLFFPRAEARGYSAKVGGILFDFE